MEKHKFSIKNLKLKHVRIYADRAEIQRSLECLVKNGKIEISIDDLSPYIDLESIKLSSNLQIADFFVHKIPEPESTRLEYETLRNEIEVTNLKIQNLDKKIKLLLNYAQNMTKNFDNSENFLKFLDLYEEKLESYELEKIKHQKLLDENTNKANTLFKKIETGNPEILFHVETAEEFFKLEITVSYVVLNVTWRPKYELRFIGKKLLLFFYCIIYQATNEDWIETSISLVTKNDKISQTVKLKVLESKTMQQMLEEMRLHIENKVKNTATLQQDVNLNILSSYFDINQILSVKSNTVSEKILIFQLELIPEMLYETFPRRLQIVYLKAKIKNTTDQFLFPGPASVYLDKNFMGNTFLKMCMPQEEFELELGIVESIKVEYKPIKIVMNKAIDKKNYLLFLQSIRIINKSDENIKIIVRDTIPLISDEKIQLKLHDPSLKNNPKVKLDKLNYLEFDLKIESGQEEEINIKYSIEHPADKKIDFV